MLSKQKASKHCNKAQSSVLLASQEHVAINWWLMEIETLDTVCTVCLQGKTILDYSHLCLQSALTHCQITLGIVAYLQWDCLVEGAPFSRAGQKPWCRCAPSLGTSPPPGGSPSRKRPLCSHGLKRKWNRRRMVRQSFQEAYRGL